MSSHFQTVPPPIFSPTMQISHGIDGSNTVIRGAFSIVLAMCRRKFIIRTKRSVGIAYRQLILIVDLTSPVITGTLSANLDCLS